MNEELAVIIAIDISASPEKVWDALTNPEKIKIYLFGTETVTDWKVGSPIIFQGEYQGRNYKDKGTIKEIISGQLLQYDYWSGFSGLEDKPENYSLVTFQIYFNNNKTNLTLRQQGFVSEQTKQHSEMAWTQILKTIKEITEKD